VTIKDFNMAGIPVFLCPQIATIFRLLSAGFFCPFLIAVF